MNYRCVCALQRCITNTVPTLLQSSSTPLLYNQRDLRLSTPLNGQASTSGIFIGSRIQITDPQGAESFISELSKKERRQLLAALQRRQNQDANSQEEDELEEITRDHLKVIFLLNTLPFIGFGFLDNFVMIIAGEYIDFTLGVWLNLSTMAAAGFGNMISDVAGIGSAHYVEYLVGRFTNLRAPKMNHEQANSSRVRFSTNLGRAFGLTVGCLLGMVPLVLYDPEKKKRLKEQQEKEENS